MLFCFGCKHLRNETLAPANSRRKIAFGKEGWLIRFDSGKRKENMMKKRSFRIGICLMAAFICISAFQVSAFAAVETDMIVADNGNGIQPIPKTYVLKDTVFYLGDQYGLMNAPEDLFIGKDGLLYVCDTGNNRVLQFDKNLQVSKVFTNETQKAFSNPQGVFVDEDGAAFVSDTGNQRIVKLSKSGKYVEEFVKPVSDLLSENDTFNPNKLAISPTGYIYAIKHQWIMQLDANNEFRGYITATEVGFDFIDWLKRLFANETQKNNMQKREPASCLSFDMMDNGALYITTVDATGQLKKINSVGNNIYPKTDMFGYQIDVGEATLKNPQFIDVAVSDNEIIFMLESWEGKVHIYDKDGQNLAIFGGLGEAQDEFTTPTAIETDNDGNVYVLDKGSNSVKIFEPTEFISTVYDAIDLYAAGEYDQAMEYWQKISSFDANYHLANKGIAQTYLKQKDWKKAMEYFELSGDKSGYSNAFNGYRQSLMENHFAVIVLIAVVILAVLFVLIKLLLKAIEKIISKYYKFV